MQGLGVLQFTVGLWEGLEGSLRPQPWLNNATPWVGFQALLGAVGKSGEACSEQPSSPISAGGLEQVRNSASESSSLALNYDALIYSLCDAYLLSLLSLSEKQSWSLYTGLGLTSRSPPFLPDTVL